MASVKVDGLAETTQCTLSRDILLQNDSISDVVLPISNLAKERDIEFALAIVLNEDQQ